MVGKETVIPYYRGKGNAIRKSDSKIRTEIVRISESHTIQPDTLYVNGEKAKPGSKLTVWSDVGSICILMHQTLDDGAESIVLVIPTINEQGQLTQLLITNPDLFSFELFEE